MKLEMRLVLRARMAAAVAVLAPQLASCSLKMTAAEFRSAYDAKDRQCPESRELSVFLPVGWIPWGYTDEGIGARQVVYQTARGERLTWCEYTRAVWDEQRAALSRGAAPSRAIYNSDRQELILQERARLAREAAEEESERRWARDKWVRRQHDDELADERASLERLRVELETREQAAALAERAREGAVSRDPYGPDEVEQALSALKTAKGEDRLLAICAGRALLRNGDSHDMDELAKAERQASKRLLKGMQPTTYEELMCNDGGSSPTCSCRGNRVGNFRGCCSHHGGVRGCEQSTVQPTIDCE